MQINIVARILFLLLGFSSGQVSAALRKCDAYYEFPCDDGKCIFKYEWCDGVANCEDQSDEYYCNGDHACLESHFSCKNGKCVPSEAVCDQQDDCGDFSDEDVCPDISDIDEYLEIRRDSFRGEIDEYAVTKAAKYLMDQRHAEYGWGSFTPRAVVAMSFAKRVSPDADKQELLKKQLNVQLLLDLMQGQNNMSLSNLALYINALHATCQDPRHFQGIDLVARLRSQTDIAEKSNLTIPLAYLTLCISGETNEYDTYHLANMYNKREFSRINSRALIMMAMICYTSHIKRDVFFNYRHNFFLEKAENADFYSKVLFMQASIASGKRVSLEKLTSEQLPDGSFGDMLATYYAIPVLTNSSLLDLKCNRTSDTGGMDNVVVKSHGENHVVYSLWISAGEDVNSHSLTLAFDGDKSFFELMLMAAARDPLYRFLYDYMDNEKRVYSIAGIPNDAEKGKSWMLYRGVADHVAVNSVQNLRLETLGVDQIFPEEKEHFVFWFKQDI